MPTITHLSQLDMNATYSYADYLMWKLRERVELIKGKVMAMSPAPTLTHQQISGNLYSKFVQVFENQPCSFFYAPFDVRLIDKKKSKDDSDIYTVVQPDLGIVCESEKLDDKGVLGAPDLVVEILSPGNSKREMNVKFELYEESGVKEYWIVDPFEKTILVYSHINGYFIAKKPLTEEEKMISPLFPLLNFDIKDIFKIKFKK